MLWNKSFVVMSTEFGKDAGILRELREISSKHSPHNCSGEGSETDKPSSATLTNEGKTENDMPNGCDGNDDGFLRRTRENPDLNQYWYSKETIAILCDAIRESLSACRGKRVAFLSTPSLFFSLPSEEREGCALFDFDRSWASCPGYSFFDYNDPTGVDKSLRGAFDLIVIDPPFITRPVWESYATTARLLAKGDESHVIATTVEENADLMKDLFGCAPVSFQPSIPHLVYQYSVFANFPSNVLARRNSEFR